MAYNDLCTEFHGQSVIDFDEADDWANAATVYRLREDYDDELSIAERLTTLLEQPGAAQLTGLIIGAWSNAQEGGEADAIVTALVEAAPKLPNLKHLFVGEITYEECEISWINQTDLSPLLDAYPKLQSLRARGGTGLAFGKVKHDALQELAIETGGLSKSSLRQIFQLELPALTHLELLLGEENYGFDGSVQDLQPLLTGKLFPKLKYLGLMNSAIADDIAAVVVNSPLVERLEVLDLSMGNMTDEGVNSLHGLAECKQLKKLNISHHFASAETVEKLRAVLTCEVIADDPQEPEDEWRPIVHAE
jgi:hypothetical protein